MVRDISDWVVVMAQGKIVAEGTPDDVMANPAVIDAYLGAHHDTDLSEMDVAQIDAEAEAELEAEVHAEEKAEEKEPS
jgi:branched-chain amino acid transport system ATP-binding protein